MQRLTLFLKRKILINTQEGLCEAGQYIFLMIGFVIACFILDIVLMLVISALVSGEPAMNVNHVSDLTVTILAFCIPSTLCFSVIPVCISVFLEKKGLRELGLIAEKSRKSIIIKMISAITLAMGIYLLMLRFPIDEAVRVLCVFAFVGINEEILVRGVLYNMLCEKFRPWISVIIASLIFAFILHSGGEFYANFLFRLPLSILLFGVYVQSKDIYASMILHMAYNVFVTCL